MNGRYEYLSNGIYWDVWNILRYIVQIEIYGKDGRYEGLSNEKNCSDSFKN